MKKRKIVICLVLVMLLAGLAIFLHQVFLSYRLVAERRNEADRSRFDDLEKLAEALVPLPSEPVLRESDLIAHYTF